MLLTTTNAVEGMRITTYYGIVSGETIIGANFVRDLFASVRDPHADTYLIPDFVSSYDLDKSADSGRAVKLADRFYKAVPQRIAGRLR